MPPESEREIPSAADFLNLPRQSDPGERLRNFDRSRLSTDSRKGRSSVESESSRGAEDIEMDPLAGDEYLKLSDKPNEKPEGVLPLRSGRCVTVLKLSQIQSICDCNMCLSAAPSCRCISLSVCMQLLLCSSSWDGCVQWIRTHGL